MKKITALLTILVCMAGSVHCQKLFILERPGTTKHHIFKTGNRIRLYDGRNKRFIQGDISRISDTAIIINSIELVSLNRILAVYRPLTILHLFSRAATTAGIGYFLLTGFNSAIDNKTKLIDHRTFVVSAVITSAGVATSFIRYRKFAIGPNWRIKIIDMNNPGQ
jgi:hypothetical protein